MIFMPIRINNPWQRTVKLLDLPTLHRWVKNSKSTTQQVLQAQEDDVGWRYGQPNSIFESVIRNLTDNTYSYM